MAQPIEGKVAKVVDEYNIIVNVGSADGVTPNMQFAIFTTGDEVVDPDSNESLGEWELVKGYVMATHVQERITVCTGVALQDGQPAADPSTHTLSAEMTRAHMAPHGSGLRVKLPVNPAEVEGMPLTGPISVGDSIRSVTP